MPGKIIKLFGITLMGAVLFVSAPDTSYAVVAYVTTGNVTNVTITSGTFNGYVNGDNSPTKAWFEYGADSSLKNSLFTDAHSFNAGYGGNYSTNVGGLSPNTTYSFRAVAQNSQGRVYGNIYSFTTNASNINITNYLLLTVKTEPASFIGTHSVQLNSLVYNEINEPSNTWFEWGTNSISLNNKTTVVQTESLSAVKHAGTLSGLAPGTTYYFRAVAENFSRRGNGSILSFVTSSNVSSDTVQNTANKNADNATVLEKQNTGATQSISSALGANVFSSGSFFPVNLLGWLILIILMLILVMLGKRLHGELSEQK